MLYREVFIFLIKLKKYIKFLVSGTLAALVNIFSLYIFHGILLWPIFLAASLSFVLAFFVSFSLQKFWTFRETSRERMVRQMSRYFLVGLFGLLLNASSMYLLVEILLVWYILAQIIMSACLAVLNFFLYRLIFGSNEPPEPTKKPVKKLLIATGLYPPDSGGPATYTRILKKELVSLGMEVGIVAYGEPEPEDGSQGINRITRRQNLLSRYFYFFLSVWREAKNTDLVYVQGPVSEGLPSYLACRLRRKKYYLKIVGDYAWEQGRQRSAIEDGLDEFQNTNYSLKVEFWRMVEILVAQGAARIIVPSEYLKKMVVGWGVEAESIIVIYNSVEIDGLVADKNELRKELGLSGRILFSAGRLVPWKGFDGLIMAVSDLSKTYPDLRLYIAGDGPDMEALKTKALPLGARVVFLGNISQRELGRYMRASDMFVLNTAYEGLSHVLIEALALETPIVTTRAGGNTELIRDRDTGLMVNFGDAFSLRLAIEEVLKNPQAALERARAGTKDLEKFSKDRMIKSIFEVIK